MEANALTPGSELAGYRIEAIEREDAGCVVALARGLAGEGAVALHVLRHAPRSLAAERFLAHARRLAGVRHPRLLAVYEVGDFGAVAERPPGRRLDELRAAGPLPPARAARLVGQLAWAVDALEAAGAEVPPLTPDRIWVDAAGAHLDPLDAGPSVPRAASSAAALAELLALISGPLPARLAEAGSRAADGAYLSPGQFAVALESRPGPPVAPMLVVGLATLVLIAAILLH